MDFPNYFADAESSFKDADFIIFGVPYDKTSSYRKGAVLGPKKIREASWNFETYNISNQVDISDFKFHDYGDLKVEKLEPKDMIKLVNDFSKKIIKANKFPIAIGGEHSITPGIIQAFPKDIAVLSLDAHIDFRKIYEDEKFNHACVIRRISEHIFINNIAVIGIRSAEKDELIDAKKQGLFYKDFFQIKEKGINNIIKETKNYLKNKKIYLTLDIDVIDPAFAPGTSTPEPFGLNPLEIIDIINNFSNNLIGFDIVETCPKYDNGQTALLAAKIIRHLISVVKT